MYQVLIQHCLTQGIAAASRSQTAASRLVSLVAGGRHFAISSSSAAATATQDNPSVTKQIHSPLMVTNRNLWSDASIGMDKLERMRERKSRLFAGPARERYIARLEKYLQEDDAKSFFKDDLINLVGIAENEHELDLLENLVLNIEPDQKELFRGWGTTLMRLYNKLGQLDRAYNNLKNVAKFGDFFNQRGCYKIVMTMMFNAGKFEDVVEVYMLADERLARPAGGHERYLSTVALAALAKMNNPEALARAEELYNHVNNDDRLSSRSIQYLVYLALNNDKPTYAVNLISQLASRQHLALKNLKLLSLIKLERYEDLLLQLREYVQYVRRDSYIMLSVTHDSIMASLEKIQEPGVRQELSDLLVEIREGGHISDANLEELIFKEIDDDPLPPSRRPDVGNNMAYSNRQRRFDDSDERPRFNPRGRQYDGENFTDQPRHQRGRQYDGENFTDQQRHQHTRPQGKRFSYQNMDFSS